LPDSGNVYYFNFRNYRVNLCYIELQSELNLFASNRSHSYFLTVNLRDAIAITERSLEADVDEEMVLKNAAAEKILSTKCK